MRAATTIAAVGLTAAVLVATPTRADEIEVVIDQVDLDEYISYLRVLTGEDAVSTDPLYYLENRWSHGDDIHIAGDWILGFFDSLGLDESLHYYDSDYGPNVVGELLGTTRPDDIYVFCGHYDTYHSGDQLHAPGCDDNGSGTAGVMMAARILSAYEFEGTLRFIAFSGEEQWMVGSSAYAAMAASQGENIVAAINLDMFLHPTFDNYDPDPDHDLDIGGNDESQWIAQIMAANYATYTPIEVEVHNDDGFVSNQWGFWQSGFDAIGAIENTAQEIWGGSNDAYHQLTDVIDNPDYEWDFALHTIRGSMAAFIEMAGLIACPADVTGDGMIDVLDLLAVLSAWGQTDVPEDITGDGIVDVLDLLEVLSAWGPC